MHAFYETLTWLGFFAAVFLSLFFYWQFRNRERMALIEKGVDISEIYKKRKNNFQFRFPWIRISLLIVGVGLGLIIALLFISKPPFPLYFGDSEEIIITSTLFLFGGIGLFIGHLIESKLNKKNG